MGPITISLILPRSYRRRASGVLAEAQAECQEAAAQATAALDGVVAVRHGEMMARGVSLRAVHGLMQQLTFQTLLRLAMAPWHLGATSISNAAFGDIVSGMAVRVARIGFGL